jgi:hypothetical protein
MKISFFSLHFFIYNILSTICEILFFSFFMFCVVNIIHLLHAGEGNMEIYSPKSIIIPEGNARG